MGKHRDDHSISNEPHLRRRDGFSPDPSEARAAENVERSKRRRRPSDEMEHAVWDEPGLSPELVSPLSKREAGYAAWLEQRGQQTGALRSWMLSFLVALCAGPWAILGVFWGAGQTWISALAIVIFGPLAEEMMKIAAPLYIVEKRPYLFRSPLQIALCALASGLVFSALENLLYLRVYVPTPSSLLFTWRWTVCVWLHVGCTFISGLGLMRVWKDTWIRRARPRIQLASNYLIIATVIHGAYNGTMLLASMAGFRT